MTASAVVTSMLSTRVRSTPHILNSWVRRSNFGALRGPAALIALGRLAILGLQGVQLLVDLAVAVGELNADEDAGFQPKTDHRAC